MKTSKKLIIIGGITALLAQIYQVIYVVVEVSSYKDRKGLDTERTILIVGFFLVTALILVSIYLYAIKEDPLWLVIFMMGIAVLSPVYIMLFLGILYWQNWTEFYSLLSPYFLFLITFVFAVIHFFKHLPPRQK